MGKMVFHCGAAQHIDLLSLTNQQTDSGPSVNSPSSQCILCIKTLSCATGKIAVGLVKPAGRIPECNQSRF